MQPDPAAGALKPVRRRTIPQQGDHVQAAISEQKPAANHRPEKNLKTQSWQKKYRIFGESEYDEEGCSQ
jgi:hypothetical protein